jgi:hypothetical protein
LLLESGQLPAIGPVKASQVATVVAQAVGAVDSDEVVEGFGVVVGDGEVVVVGTELEDSDTVRVTDDRESNSTIVVLELDAISERWGVVTLEKASGEVDEEIALEEEIGAG